MASSECSSGCQSGWTTYLDDDHSSSSRSCGTGRQFHGKAAQHYYCDFYSEEDDLSMISDASSGPLRHHCSAGNDVVEAAARATSASRGRRVADAASSARRQSRKAAAALLEDTASSPAFFGYSKATSLLGEANGYCGDADDEPMVEIGNAADFSCAFSATTTTGFKSPINGTALDGYLQMQYSPAASAKPMMPTRQVFRDAGETKRW